MHNTSSFGTVSANSSNGLITFSPDSTKHHLSPNGGYLFSLFSSLVTDSCENECSAMLLLQRSTTEWGQCRASVVLYTQLCVLIMAKSCPQTHWSLHNPNSLELPYTSIHQKLVMRFLHNHQLYFVSLRDKIEMSHLLFDSAYWTCVLAWWCSFWVHTAPWTLPSRSWIFFGFTLSVCKQSGSFDRILQC